MNFVQFTSQFKYLTPSSRLTNSLSAIKTTQTSTAATRCHHHDYGATVATQVSTCTTLQHLTQIHSKIIQTRFLDFYPAPFYWNNIMRSYTRLDSPKKAIQVFIAMSRAGVSADEYTLPIMLKATSQVSNYGLAKQIHAHALKIGLSSNVYCESGFISLYAKACEFEDAHKVFDESGERALGSWNAMISGLAQGGRAKEALEMFLEMKKTGLHPDDVTMVSVTSACGNLGDLKLGLQLHKCVFQVRVADKYGILIMKNSLIDMYGKCGRMDLAHRVFSSMDERNVSSWTSMIVGYALHGHAMEALKFFHHMREAGVKPNHVTFVGVLSACVHGGKVEEGKHYFNMMENEYRIAPKLQHYGCMVDLLGRAGLFEEAREMVEGMPMKPNVVVWGCLMGACEKHRNVKMGEWVAKHLQEMEPWNDGVYVVLSNIYASNGLWEEVERMREIMKLRKLAKIPAFSLPSTSQ
nr:pentatricopeptide repeat-containing protein At1g77170 [Ipomoea batatas]GME03434.1 pentatricopeptide repeat-containing protein At1g77170 [Ipomoea batatas]